MSDIQKTAAGQGTDKPLTELFADTVATAADSFSEGLPQSAPQSAPQSIPDLSNYVLSEEEKGKLEVWAKDWVEKAKSTTPMTVEDQEIMRKAIKGQYESVEPPVPWHDNVIFVASPIMARFVGGFLAAWYYMQDHPEEFVPAPAAAAA